MAGLRIGFDIGGTFTDLVLYDEASGRIHSHKLATTAHSPEAAVRAGWRTLLAEAGFPVPRYRTPSTARL